MYYDKQKVIDWAYSQIGYNEGENNWNKYAEIMDKVKDFYNGVKQSAPWCDVWVDAGFYVCYGREGALFLLCQPEKSCGAGCSFSAQYYNDKGQFHKTGPQKGDQIFFGNSWSNVWHTGLVVDVQSSHVVTIEGNTSDQVAKRSYALSDPSIWGYGRPDWGTPDDSEQDSTDSNSSEIPNSSEPQAPVQIDQNTYSVKLPLLMIGDRGGYVKTLQTLLIARGYDCGNKPLIGVEKADGEFGQMTEKAVAFFQSRQRLRFIDGEVGGETWAALLKDWG